MISLASTLLKSGSNNLEHIQEGLEHLYQTTHIVGKQIKDNEAQYYQHFNKDKFSNKIGTIEKFLGSGVFGAVFKLTDGKTFKLTFDYKEAPFLYQYCFKRHAPGFVIIDDLYEDEFGKTPCFYVIRDPVTKIKNQQAVYEVLRDFNNREQNTDYNEPTKDGVARALRSMLAIDPKWRITHDANLGVQNGSIVLYDGFSKNVVPAVNIEKF